MVAAAELVPAAAWLVAAAAGDDEDPEELDPGEINLTAFEKRSYLPVVALEARVQTLVLVSKDATTQVGTSEHSSAQLSTSAAVTVSITAPTSEVKSHTPKTSLLLVTVVVSKSLPC